MLYPPRPESRVIKTDLTGLENRGWIGQLKMNGTSSLTETTSSGSLTYTRHLEPHKAWDPNSSTSLPKLLSYGSGFLWVYELLHSKVSGGPKDTLYIHDILLYPNEDLFGSTYEERHKLLCEILQPKPMEKGILMITPKLWVAENLVSELEDTFNTLSKPWHEGLVVKNPKGKLGRCSNPTHGSSWAVKCRKPTANYSN